MNMKFHAVPVILYIPVKDAHDDADFHASKVMDTVRAHHPECVTFLAEDFINGYVDEELDELPPCITSFCQELRTA